jgi:hypothetical protein
VRRAHQQQVCAHVVEHGVPGCLLDRRFSRGVKPAQILRGQGVFGTGKTDSSETG